MRLVPALIIACLPVAAIAHDHSGFVINNTSWSFVEGGKKHVESVDAKGNYIAETADGKHVDHGTAVVKGSKVCFTSAMTKDGEVCWTTHPTKIGGVMNTVSDKGEKLAVTRIKYRPLHMPK